MLLLLKLTTILINIAIIEASKSRGDNKHIYISTHWKAIEFHEECRRDYVNIFCIRRDLKRQEFLKADSKRPASLSEDSTPSSSTLKIRLTDFEFHKMCFFCGSVCDDKISKKKKSGKNRICYVATDSIKNTIINKAEICNNDEVHVVMQRVLSIDLVEKKARYHLECYYKFTKLKGSNEPVKKSKGKQIDSQAEESFQKLFEWLDESEDVQFNLYDLKKCMTPYQPPLKYLKKTLALYYGNSIVFNKSSNKQTVTTFREHLDTILNDNWYKSRETDESAERKRILKAAADIIRNDIVGKVYNINEYPPPDQFLNNATNDVPESLQYLLEQIILCNKKAESFKGFLTKITSISHAIISATRPRGFISSIQLGLAVYFHRKFGSQLLIDVASHLGYCASYKSVNLYESSVVMQGTDNQTFTPTTKLLKQFVYDNVDSNINTEDGKNTLHCLGGVEINTPSDCVPKSLPVKKLKKIPPASLITAKGQVNINYYNNPERGSLSDVKLLDLQLIRSTDNGTILFDNSMLAWFIGKWLSIDNFPGWHGHMEKLCEQETYATTKIQALPFIDLQATNKDAINTCLFYASEEFKKANQKIAFVTFDQQLYQKAREMLATYGSDENSELSNVIIRLGGFHLLMSYLGVIGNIMEGSGLKEIFVLNYAENSTPKILNGHHYARAVRAHLLTVNSLISVLFKEMEITGEEKQRLQDILLDTQQNLDTLTHNEDITDLADRFQRHLDSVRDRGKTAKLWLEYIRMIGLLLNFIHAERFGDFKLHLDTIQLMIPYFHAGDHTKYAKSAHLYVQDMLKFQKKKYKYPEVYQNLVTKGYFTIKRTDKFWTGTSPDMIIEQFLMRAIKAVGGITRRGFSASTAALWILTMPATVELCITLEKFCGVESHTTEQHVDARESSIQRFNKHTIKIMKWLEEHPPFPQFENLKSISSGVIGDDSINCWNALEIGKTAIGRQLEKNADFGNLTSPRTDKVKPLSKMSLSVKKKSNASDIDIPVDSTILFNRIIRCNKDADELEECFGYEMTPIPMSLFDQGGLRRVDETTVFSAFLTVKAPKIAEASFIVDGEELLSRIPWQKSMTFQKLYEDTSQYILKYYKQNCLVVFESYDCNDLKILDLRQNSSHEILFEETGLIPSNKNKNSFLSNEKNKVRLIQQLKNKLEAYDIKVQCVRNSDLFITNKATQIADTNSNVIVVTQNPDVLILLIANCDEKDVFVKNSGVKGKEQWYSIIDIKNQNPQLHKHILFLHAATGCRTTSAIFGKGKKTVFKLVMKDIYLDLLEKLNSFYVPGQDPEVITPIGEEFLLALYNAPKKIISLNRLRYIYYCQQSMKNKTGVNLSSLPPTLNATKQHFFRVYRQILEWKSVPTNYDSWGWNIDNNKLIPVMTSDPIAPEELLNLISCACKKGCGLSCSCRKAGLRCSPVCKSCFGTECSNSSEITTEAENFEQDFGDNDTETDVDSEIDYTNSDNQNHFVSNKYANLYERSEEESDQEEEEEEEKEEEII